MSQSNNESVLETKFNPNSRLVKIIKTNNEILSNSRYHNQTVSPRKIRENGFHSNHAGILSPQNELELSLNNMSGRGGIQPFLPFLNLK